MNAEQMIAREKRLKRANELLRNKARTPEESNELIDFLAEKLAEVTVASIRHSEQIIVQQGAIETLASMVGAEKDEGPIIGIKPPPIVLNS